MVKIKAFDPLNFVEDIKNVISPPFDSISKNLENKLKKNPHNITHLTLSNSESSKSPGDLLREWISDKVVVNNGKKSIFLLDQEYRSKNEVSKLLGIVSLVNIFPDDGSVKPHEKTFPIPIEERIRIMESAGAQLEPIYLFVDSPELEMALTRCRNEMKPKYDFNDFSDVTNKVYELDENSGNEIASIIENLPAVVADGHHRLAASKRLASNSDGVKREFWSWIMAYIVPLGSNGLKIKGIHRIVKNCADQKSELKKIYEISELNSDENNESFKIYDREWHPISPCRKFCDENPENCLSPIHLLNNEILAKTLGFKEKDFQASVIYTHDLDQAISEVDEGTGIFSAIIPDWDKDNLIRLILEKGYLPQKSTFFYPKPPSGVFINAIGGV